MASHYELSRKFQFLAWAGRSQLGLKPNALVQLSFHQWKVTAHHWDIISCSTLNISGCAPVSAPVSIKLKGLSPPNSTGRHFEAGTRYRLVRTHRKAQRSQPNANSHSYQQATGWWLLGEGVHGVCGGYSAYSALILTGAGGGRWGDVCFQL